MAQLDLQSQTGETISFIKSGSSVIIHNGADTTHIDDSFELYTDEKSGKIEWFIGDGEQVCFSKPCKEWQLSTSNAAEEILKLNTFLFGVQHNKNLINLRNMLGGRNDG